MQVIPGRGAVRWEPEPGWVRPTPRGVNAQDQGIPHQPLLAKEAMLSSFQEIEGHFLGIDNAGELSLEKKRPKDYLAFGKALQKINEYFPYEALAKLNSPEKLLNLEQNLSYLKNMRDKNLGTWKRFVTNVVGAGSHSAKECRTAQKMETECYDTLLKRIHTRIGEEKIIARLRDFEDTKGLFRESGNKTQVDELVKKLVNGDPIGELPQDPHAIAGAYKGFFRDMRDKGKPILSAENFDTLKQIVNETKRETRKSIMGGVLKSMSSENRIHLADLLGVLNRVALKAETNLMKSSNLAITVAPNLFTAPQDLQDLSDLSLQCKIVDQLIQDA